MWVRLGCEILAVVQKWQKNKKFPLFVFSRKKYKKGVREFFATHYCKFNIEVFGSQNECNIEISC
jgi:hypothetical protein